MTCPFSFGNKENAGGKAKHFQHFWILSNCILEVITKRKNPIEE
jgi:hypothetical protein